MAIIKFIAILFFSLGVSAKSQTSIYHLPMKPANLWLEHESRIATEKLEQNIAPAGTVAGVVIASPQKQDPNYFRHWVRDGALTMHVVLQLWKRATTSEEKSKWQTLLMNYVNFSRQNQLSQTLVGLGEPIFEVDGTPFLGPWGRPQNDGPALRAVVLTDWALNLLEQGQRDFVLKNLYNSKLPANSLIKADLEYVSHHWQESCFDLWEEVKAQHFYTKMVQRKALLLGAQLARQMNDGGAANWYEMQGRGLENSISLHANTGRDWVVPSMDWDGGHNSKPADLDSAVILGVLHGQLDSFFNVSNRKVQNTFTRLNEVFSSLYSINKTAPLSAPALGRYPEDIYAGSNFDGGNPWVLTTLAAAEYAYNMAFELGAKKSKKAHQWIEMGDRFVQRVQYHANPDGSLSEQMDRRTGFMTSARDLTWNYAAVLTAFWARNKSILTISKGLNK